MREKMVVHDKAYSVIKLLGKGKGGYFYLATDGRGQYVLKQIHHEPCDYDTFGNKIEAELRDYERLAAVGIPMPRLLDVDAEQECILKEYIEGDTVYDLVLRDEMREAYFERMRAMCRLLYPAQLNIDYFPTNFVVQGGTPYYIDFECNEYMEQWDFEHWGIKYWSKTPEFLRYAKEHTQGGLYGK